MLERVAETISRYSMFRADDPVGVAVSGGADSVFLLHALRELAPTQPLFVLHLNHKLRGADADADAEFVREQAAALSLPYEVREAPGGDRDNLEQAGRRARLAFFHDVLRRGVVARVATGHTSDDQAETVLYRLLRGAGTQGLRGILPVTREGLVRPLLNCRRSEIEAWLIARALRWREDSTNRDTRFVRNRIRHSLLPLLEREYNAGIRDTLVRTAEIAGDEEAYWLAEVSRVAGGLFTRDAGALVIDLQALRNLPIALVRRLFRQAVASVRGGSRGLEAGHIEAVLALSRQSRGEGGIHLPGVEVRRSFSHLRFMPAHSCNTASLRAQVTESYNGSGPIDADSVPTGAELRPWRPGDRMELTTGRTVKLKVLFQRARIPVWERQKWPVFAIGSEVIWTRRFGVGAPYAAGRQTRRFLEVVEAAGA
ncbi:MAG TPA: tRNA lysidine(34) synthetase TilS [Bryobacteraceae bacterium]|nr:tRNA lysidine(34) synthetase TilS [Bryobacteraceae bacterium]